MSNIGALKTEIQTFLDNSGFTQYQQELEKSKEATKGFGDILKNTFNMNGIKNMASGVKGTISDMFNFKKAFGGVLSNPFTQLIGGYFTLTGAIGQYNKMVNASNKQFSLQTALDTSLKSQGYLDEQIQSLKTYMGELQNLGVIGDEASIVAVKSMASFKLKEDTIRQLLPQVHNLMVAEKGLNSTEADAEKWAKAMGVAIQSGQIRGLKQAGIILDEHTQKIFESANEQQRASILYKELTERIGDQNAEILKTPEGKIINAQNRIGDMYERFGEILRQTRGKFWTFIADNLDMLAPFTEKVIKALTNGFDTGINTVQFLFNTFSNMPSGAKNTIKLLTGFFLIKKFPIAGGIIILEDIFGAFQGKDSVIEGVFNKMTEFFNSNYKFDDLRKGVWEFFDVITKQSKIASEELSKTAKNLYRIYSFFAMIGNIPSVIGSGALLSFEIADNVLSGKDWNNDLDKESVEAFKNFRDNSIGLIHGMSHDDYLEMLNRKNENINKTIENLRKNQEYQSKHSGSLSVPTVENVYKQETIKQFIATNNNTKNYINDVVNTQNNTINKNFNNDNREFLNTINKNFEDNTRIDTKNVEITNNNKEVKLMTEEQRQKINNSSVNINSNPTFNLTIENVNGNKDDIRREVVNAFENLSQKQLQALKTTYGSGFSIGGAY